MANKIIQYLYNMRSRAIYYKGDKEGINDREKDTGIRNKGQDNKRNGKNKMQSFICVSDASFADNLVDRKSL